MLKKEPDIEVIAALQTDEKMLTKIQTSDIDVVLLDLGLQSYDSLDVVKLIRKNDDEVNIVLMGLFATHSEVLDFVEYGVKGFILKDATVTDFWSQFVPLPKTKKYCLPTLPNHCLLKL